MKYGMLPGLLLLQFVAVAQKVNYLLKGKIGNYNSPAKMFLLADNKMDSAVMNNGVFLFKGLAAAPQNAMLFLSYNGDASLKKNSDVFHLYLENGVISLDSKDSLHKAAITAPALNRANEKLKAALKPADDALAAMFKTLVNTTTRSEAFLANYRANREVYQAQRQAALKHYILTNNNTLVSLDAVKDYGGAIPNIDSVQPLFNKLSYALQHSPAGKQYAETLSTLSKTTIGTLAPDFNQNDTSGRLVSLSSFRGRYVLLDFWASWCGPCRAENPNVVKVFNEYSPKGFTVLGVSLDQENAREQWVKAIDKDGLTWPNVSDLKGWSNSAAQLYGVRAIPQNFLIDPSGKIIAKNLRGKELDDKLAEVLGK